MWKSILFDLDGTLTDSKEGILNSIIYALKHFGIEESRERMMKFIGPPLYESLRESYGFDDAQSLAGTEKFQEYYSSRGWLENAPYPGIRELLRDLKASGKRLYVATSKPEGAAVRILEHFELAEYFDAIAGSSDRRGAKKLEVIRKALGPRTADALMVGDRKHDVIGAHGAGLPAAGVLYGYGSRGELEAAGADLIVEDVGALRRLLLEAPAE